MNFQSQRTEGRSQKTAGRNQPTESRLRFAVICILLPALWLAGGCSKAPAPQRSPAPTPLATNSVVRVHWAGKQTLGVAASAYSLMRLWSLPEGKQLEGALLTKLATAPARLLTNSAANQSAGALRQMFYEVVNEEAGLEIRTEAGRNEQLAFALRLNNERAREWDKQLAVLLTATEGGYPARHAGGWSLTSPRSQTVYELSHTGNWIVLGIAKGANTLMQEIVARIGREQVPFTVTTNEHWLTVEADLNWVREKTASGMPPADRGDGPLPRVALRVTGDGANTITTGELLFAQPLNLNLEPWNFPTNQIQAPVIGFSAARGVSGWLAGTKLWTDLKLGPAPNQLFTWADAQTPLQMYFAAPTGSARETARALGENFLAPANVWLAEHALGSIVPLPNASGVLWKDLPVIAPYVGAKNDALLVGGLVANAKPQPGAAAPVQIFPRPALEELLATINRHTNLVAYEWETTGARAESTHVLGQLLRAITRHPQLPAGTGSSVWLQAARNRLGNCTTTVTLAGPNRLAFERKSSMGFNALELHLIADWMESPEFPRGFYSTLSPVGPALQPLKP